MSCWETIITTCREKTDRTKMEGGVMVAVINNVDGVQLAEEMAAVICLKIMNCKGG